MKLNKKIENGLDFFVELFIMVQHPKKRNKLNVISKEEGM